MTAQVAQRRVPAAGTVAVIVLTLAAVVWTGVAAVPQDAPRAVPTNGLAAVVWTGVAAVPQDAPRAVPTNGLDAALPAAARAAMPARGGGGTGGGRSSSSRRSSSSKRSSSSNRSSSEHAWNRSSNSSRGSSHTSGVRPVAAGTSTDDLPWWYVLIGLAIILVPIAVLVFVIWLIVRAVRGRSAARPEPLASWNAHEEDEDADWGDTADDEDDDGSGGPHLPGGSLGAGFAQVGRSADRAELDRGLAAIKGHDPQFDLDAFRVGAQRVFFAVQQAWTTREPGISRQVMAEPLWQAHRTQIEAQRIEGTVNRLDGLAVQSIAIVGLASQNGYDSIIARFFANSADYTLDGNDRFVRGHQDIQDWSEDWLFQRRADARTRPNGGMLAANCPHCGAALNLDLAGVCSYCGGTAVDGSDWVLTRIDQLPSWDWAQSTCPR